eukprot:CAMPEP_0168325156 /NCGR_PEP_ID=MMETSP0213-20121227/4525_1 /TAXON_ID=151035 /ORGANISM="Euplotes harpa, Strain FSP1.4" /LENGTH=56 /DNA_ID=CAMNT_0008327597 /DNA_START=159 /DNA_END=329 /DNA_ORIENTATION=-
MPDSLAGGVSNIARVIIQISNLIKNASNEDDDSQDEGSIPNMEFEYDEDDEDREFP